MGRFDNRTDSGGRGKGLTEPGAFDTSERVVLTDCSAPSSGALLCNIQIPGLGLVDLS